MHFFRLSLPRMYPDEESVSNLVQTAVRFKLGEKKLKKLEEEYLLRKAEEAELQDPMEVGGLGWGRGGGREEGGWRREPHPNLQSPPPVTASHQGKREDGRRPCAA